MKQCGSILGRHLEFTIAVIVKLVHVIEQIRESTGGAILQREDAFVTSFGESSGDHAFKIPTLAIPRGQEYSMNVVSIRYLTGLVAAFSFHNDTIVAEIFFGIHLPQFFTGFIRRRIIIVGVILAVIVVVVVALIIAHLYFSGACLGSYVFVKQLPHNLERDVHSWSEGRKPIFAFYFDDKILLVIVFW
jgi:hypothetical protein